MKINQTAIFLIEILIKPFNQAANEKYIFYKNCAQPLIIYIRPIK